MPTGFDQKSHKNERVHLRCADAGVAQLNVPGPPEPLVLKERGRRHYEPVHSATGQFRPHQRMNEDARARRGADASPSGRRHFLPQPSGEDRQRKERPGMRPIPGLSRRSGYDVPEAGLDLQKKHVVVKNPETGELARDHISGELTLEKTFGMKKKIAEARDMRNGIEQAYPGDKLYHHVDYSPGFHKEAGKVVGSSFVRVQPGVAQENRLAELGAGSEGTLGYSLKYRQGACVPLAQKLACAARASDIAAVADLVAY